MQKPEINSEDNARVPYMVVSVHQFSFAAYVLVVERGNGLGLKLHSRYLSGLRLVPNDGNI